MQSKFNNIKITSISTVLGENQINFYDQPQYWGHNQTQYEKLRKTIGFNSRYVADNSTTTFDLSYAAAKRLIDFKNVDISDIDAIISITQTPDYKTPGNAYLLHKKLKMKNTTAAFDLTLGCSGYIYGLFFSYSLINSGLKKVLLVTGDTLSKAIHPNDKSEAPLFGDGASATIIEYTDENTPSFFILNSDGNGYKHLYQPAGGYRLPNNSETRQEYTDTDNNVRCAENLYINGFEIFKFTLSEQPKMLQKILDFSNQTKNDIDLFFIHQANSYIVKTLANNLKFDIEKTPYDSFSKFGNLNSASIPAAICDKYPDKIIDNKISVLQGFGVGLSWGICCLNLKGVTCLKPIQYIGELYE